ncbi:hypothetical protein [Verrucomicrobium sp. BvORR034]|uniref:hypothetical protein n=1 Tax=Verrucomicrobium sp. BvORR034 TaxID=1396418 RepID=UPI0006790666|nr:hypothetical protein [Verrucomicrobium sp. BvORR034]
MSQPSQVIIPPQSKRWHRIPSWILVAVLAIVTFGMLYMGIVGYLRHRSIWDCSPVLFSLYLCISALRSQWINLFPRVLTATAEGLQLQAGAFPFRKRWLAPWKDAALLRYDEKLVLAGVGARFFRTATIESHLSDPSRDMLIARLNTLCQEQGITLPSEDIKLSLYEAEDSQQTAGGTDRTKFWKG